MQTDSQAAKSEILAFNVLFFFFSFCISNSPDQVFAGDVPEANNKCLQKFRQETGCYLNKCLELAAEVHQNATTDFFFFSFSP